MAAVDRDVYASTDGARYATAIYGVLDASSSRLTLVNAGHPAAVVLSQVTRTLGATGPALGLIDAGSFGSHSVKLMPGTLLVAYTDGASEAQDANDEEFGDHNVSGVIEQVRDLSAAQICAQLLTTITQFRGVRQDQDDVTVMVVKALGAEGLGLGA
jgi:serine phosphatase RsbU (regulator of sigma subunit)